MAVRGASSSSTPSIWDKLKDESYISNKVKITIVATAILSIIFYALVGHFCPGTDTLTARIFTYVAGGIGAAQGISIVLLILNLRSKDKAQQLSAETERAGRIQPEVNDPKGKSEDSHAAPPVGNNPPQQQVRVPTVEDWDPEPESEGTPPLDGLPSD